jgi:nitrogen fixation-related uncharacterized protein
MAIFYGLLLASMILLGGSAVYALFWAAEDGQFTNMESGSKIIFDEGEPEGEITDTFPGVDARREIARKQARRAARAGVPPS